MIFFTARQCLQAIRRLEGLREQQHLHLQSHGINLSMSWLTVRMTFHNRSQGIAQTELYLNLYLSVTVTMTLHIANDCDLQWEAQTQVWVGKSWRWNMIFRRRHHLYSWSAELTATIHRTQRITETKKLFPPTNRIQLINDVTWELWLWGVFQRRPTSPCRSQNPM